jgi:mono/diheme cytochrome c family protein
MKDLITKPLLTVTTYVVIAISSQIASAGSKNLMPVNAPPIYQQECGSCHMPYPPALLPKASWAEIMNGLQKHFGTDASLSQQEMEQISSWLNSHAGTYKRVKETPPDNRITKSDWFVKKHRKINSKEFLSQAIKSRSNCNTCHKNAEQGNFDDDEVRIPK